MRDVVFVLIVAAFFTAATAYVRACAWIGERGDRDVPGPGR